MSASTRRVCLSTFFSSPPDSPSLSKVLRQSTLSSASPSWKASSTHPSRYQLQTTMENFMFGVMSPSSLPNGAPGSSSSSCSGPRLIHSTSGLYLKENGMAQILNVHPAISLISPQQRRYQVLSASMAQTSACANSNNSSKHRPRSVPTHTSPINRS